jgi:hypothetical protein
MGMNEAVFRDVNERIEEVGATFNLTQEPLDMICECGDATCVDRITINREEYERVRADPHLFVVASGHEVPDVEDVVARRPGYEIVRKREGVQAEIAEKTDPRSES